jgi:hypothetical protein
MFSEEFSGGGIKARLLHKNRQSDMVSAGKITSIDFIEDPSIAAVIVVVYIPVTEKIQPVPQREKLAKKVHNSLHGNLI